MNSDKPVNKVTSKFLFKFLFIGYTTNKTIYSKIFLFVLFRPNVIKHS